MARALIRAAAAGGCAWCLAFAGIWLHIRLGLGGTYLGQGYPMWPGLKVREAGLVLDSALATLPVLPLVALPVLLGRVAALPGFALGWYVAAEAVVAPYVIDFGTTWASGEAFRALFWRYGFTETVLLCSLGLLWVLLGRVGPRAKDASGGGI